MRGEDPGPRFLADENFNKHIVAGLRRILPSIDLLTAVEANTLGLLDPEVLEWARVHDRIVLTHDIQTMPTHFYAFLTTLTPGSHSPGVMRIEQNYSIGLAIAAIREVWELSAQAEWQDLFTYLPL